jgi:hypothetical protein
MRDERRPRCSALDVKRWVVGCRLQSDTKRDVAVTSLLVRNRYPMETQAADRINRRPIYLRKTSGVLPSRTT